MLVPMTLPQPSDPDYYSRAIELQKAIAKRVIAADQYGKINYVCGVDISYRDNIAYCCAVVVKRSDLSLAEAAYAQTAVNQAYIPGLFMLRESGPIMHTLTLLKSDFDLLMVDGHGQLHPRKCGLACYIGVTINKPAMGVAKKLLCGKVRKNGNGGGSVELDGQVFGRVISKRKRRKNGYTINKTYVSVGHRISLESAVRFAKELTRRGEWIPEPLRIADAGSKNRANFV
jgi:deoxyribonuclease V